MNECQVQNALHMLQNAMDSVLESQQQSSHSGHPGLVPPSQHHYEHDHDHHHNSRTKKKKKKKTNPPASAASTDGWPTAWSILQDGFGMGYKLVWIDQMTYQQLDTIKNNRNCSTIKDVIQLLIERYASSLGWEKQKTSMPQTSRVVPATAKGQSLLRSALECDKELDDENGVSWYGNNSKSQRQSSSMPQTSSMDVSIPPTLAHEDETKDQSSLTSDLAFEKELDDSSCGGRIVKKKKVLADGSIKVYTYHRRYRPFRKQIGLTFLSQSHQVEFMDKMETAINRFKEKDFSRKVSNVAFLDNVFEVYLHQTSYQSLPNQDTAIVSAAYPQHDWDVDSEEEICSYTIKCLLDDLYWPGIVYADDEDLEEEDTEEKSWTFKLEDEDDQTKNEMGAEDEEDDQIGACRNEDGNDEDADLDPLQFGNSGSDVKLENGNPFVASDVGDGTLKDQSQCVEINSESGDTNSDVHTSSGGRTEDTHKLSLDESKKGENIIPHMLPSKLKCKVCGKIVISHAEMKHHIAATHNDQQAPVPKRHTDQFVKEKMLGNIDSSQSLTDFEVSALSTVMRLCPVCNSYVPEYTVKGHMNKHGYGSKFINVYCCNIRFRAREKLKIHKQSGDDHGNSEVICEMCGKMCTDMSRLQKHRKLHTNQRLSKKIKEYTCEICGKILRTSTSFVNHKKIHLTVKPHQCPECGKGFSQPTNMRIHMRIHSGDKPYKCDMCTEAYAHNVSLKTHKKKVHGIDMWAVKSEETPP